VAWAINSVLLAPIQKQKSSQRCTLALKGHLMEIMRVSKVTPNSETRKKTNPSFDNISHKGAVKNCLWNLRYSPWSPCLIFFFYSPAAHPTTQLLPAQTAAPGSVCLLECRRLNILVAHHSDINPLPPFPPTDFVSIWPRDAPIIISNNNSS